MTAGAGGRASAGGGAGMSSSLGGSSSGNASGGSSAGAAGANSFGGTSAGGASGSSSTGGAPAGSGGRVDGAGTGGGGGATAGSGCEGKTYKLCEDFETGTVGQLPPGWTLQNSSTPQNAALATDEAHSGKMSLKADDLGKSGAARALRSLTSLGATAGKHWGRIFYKVQDPAPKPASGVIQNTWVTLNAAEGTNQVVDTVENSDGMHQWIYLRHDNGCGFGSDYDWKFDDAWHCAEWYVDGPGSAYRFFADSTEVKINDFPGTNACFKVANGFTGILVGSLTYAPPTGRRVVWFDDLAIDDNRIGCN